MNKNLLLIVFIQIFILNCFAYPICHFRHYSTEDGLPQYNIMDILQDKKGFMWFATWDGLSKYDGYKFHNYKVKAGDNYYMKSNRIEKLYNDKYNRIWFRTYDGEFHCFNQETQKFWGTQLMQGSQNFVFKNSKIEIKPSGKVWLISTQSGCILVKDSLFNTEVFNTDNKKLKGISVFSVLEDKQLNSWLLTNNGLCFIDQKSGRNKFIFYEKEGKDVQLKQAFYSAIDRGNIILFGSQKGRLWTYHKNNGKFVLTELPVKSGIVNIIPVNSENYILVTENDGFLLYNSKTQKNKLCNTSTLPELVSDEISDAVLLDSRYFWFSSKSIGIYRFDLQSLQLNYYKVDIEDASAHVYPARTIVIKDVSGHIWVQPKGGGFSLFNAEKNRLEAFFNSNFFSNWRFSNILHSAYSDIQGNLWMCTRSHGLEKVVFDKNLFQPEKINEKSNSIISNEVRAVFEDNDLNLWVSTKDCKLKVYDKNRHPLGYFSLSGEIVNNAYMPAMVYCITQDKQKNIWLGTKGYGVYVISKKPNSGYHVKHYIQKPEDVYSLSDNLVYSIFQDSKDRIWIGTYGGGLNLVSVNQNEKISFINHRNNLKNFPIEEAYNVRFITEVKDGNIALGTTSGLVMFSSRFTDVESINFKSYTRASGTSSLSSNDVHGICYSKKGDMYLATFGGGINKVTGFDKNGFPVSFKVYGQEQGLPSDIILALVEDEFGKIWVSSENNLSKFDPDNEVIETFAEIKRLMNINNFSEASTCKTKSGNIIIGYSNGIVSFSPRHINNNCFKPHIALLNLQIFNKDVQIGTKNSPLKKDFNSIEKLELTHAQNFINIEYAALDFVDPENIIYAYKLEGFDPDWIYAHKQRIANYTNLPKGEYLFRVKSTNSEGVWIDNERSLPIEVLPSFWESAWAYPLYLILFFGLVFLFSRIYISFYRLRADVTLEKQMSEMRLRFFTDISHEIRTPLTMITAPIEHMINSTKTPDEMKKQLKSISQNANRLLRLVNQILDFRKIQFTHLKVTEIELAPFVEEICDNFSEIAIEKHIKFEFINEAHNEGIWVDPDCLEKIVMNLLSNAFKYTSSGKQIQVKVLGDDKYVSVQVQDKGRGLSKEKQKNLFVRFASFNEDKSKPSTGIGLSMVKDLADKHSARIAVESEEGKGSTFTVSFLRGKAHFDKNVEIIDSAVVPKNTDNSVEVNSESTKELHGQPYAHKHESKPSVLIVEDDDDLRQFIRSIIEENYYVYEATDGQDGWEKSQDYCPDFIVSDIMMPRMDGIELLKKIKTNITTSHIPVVLLTAKTTIESKLEGLAYGADDYITKPFNVQYFQARISNLIQQRRQLQEMFRSNISSNSITEFQPQPFSFTSHDEGFMQKVLKKIEENIDNSDYRIDELFQDLLVSRSVFFKKVKGLTGFSPGEFMRDIRMKRAAQILESGEFMVKEVAYMVGISDTKYFTKCFRAKYGVSPMEYKNRNANKH